MIKIAICDDDYQFGNKVKEYIDLIKIENENFNLEVDVFTSGIDFVRRVNDNERFDIVFLDIKMPTINGVEVGRELRSIIDTVIVYISASIDYFIEIFNIKPFGFLKKPIKFSDFKNVFFVIYKHIFNLNNVYEFKSGKFIIKIKFKDIIYFKSYGRKIILHTKDEKYDFNGKICDVYETVKDFDFMFIHKSYLINYNHVCKMNYDYVVMDNDEKFDISSRRRKDIRRQYLEISDRNGI